MQNQPGLSVLIAAVLAVIPVFLGELFRSEDLSGWIHWPVFIAYYIAIGAVAAHFSPRRIWPPFVGTYLGLFSISILFTVFVDPVNGAGAVFAIVPAFFSLVGSLLREHVCHIKSDD